MKLTSIDFPRLVAEGCRSSLLQTLGNQLVDHSPYVRYTNHNYDAFLTVHMYLNRLIRLKWTCVHGHVVLSMYTQVYRQVQWVYVTCCMHHIHVAEKFQLGNFDRFGVFIWHGIFCQIYMYTYMYMYTVHVSTSLRSYDAAKLNFWAVVRHVWSKLTSKLFNEKTFQLKFLKPQTIGEKGNNCPKLGVFLSANFLIF